MRMVFKHQHEHASQGSAIGSIAAKSGCTAKTLRSRVRQAAREGGTRAGATGEERDRIRTLEREVREVRQASGILRQAAAYSARAEHDRRFRP